MYMWWIILGHMEEPWRRRYPNGTLILILNVILKKIQALVVGLWDSQKPLLPRCMLPMRTYNLACSMQYPWINLASVLVMFLVSHFVSVPWIPYAFLGPGSYSKVNVLLTLEDYRPGFFFFPASLACYERYGGSISLLGIHQTMDIAEDHGKHRQPAHLQEASMRHSETYPSMV